MCIITKQSLFFSLLSIKSTNHNIIDVIVNSSSLKRIHRFHPFPPPTRHKYANVWLDYTHGIISISLCSIISHVDYYHPKNPKKTWIEHFWWIGSIFGWISQQNYNRLVRRSHQKRHRRRNRRLSFISNSDPTRSWFVSRRFLCAHYPFHCWPCWSDRQSVFWPQCSTMRHRFSGRILSRVMFETN